MPMTSSYQSNRTTSLSSSSNVNDSYDPILARNKIFNYAGSTKTNKSISSISKQGVTSSTPSFIVHTIYPLDDSRFTTTFPVDHVQWAKMQTKNQVQKGQ